LRDAITLQPWGFKKIARIAYLAGAIVTPQLVRTKLSPLVYKVKTQFNSSGAELLTNNSENGAYLVKHPEPILSNRANVVHVIANFMTGGSSRLVVDLIESLGTHYQQRVVTSFIPAPAAYVGVDIIELRFPVDEQPFVDYFSQLKPDLIHVHYWGDCDESWYAKAITAAEKLNIPVIENINTPVAPYISNVIRRYVYVSDYVRHVFGQNDPSHVTIYPGSDFSHFSRKFGERVAGDCIGMVYRLERDKLNEDAIDPFIRAVKKRQKTRVLIVGGGSLLEPFRQKVAEAGLSDSFEFTGYVSYDALPDLYRRMSVFVAPVWKESFGQVSPFAMNMRIPVVGYDIGAIGEIVSNQALLAEPGNAEMLSDIIVRLLDSPSERKRIGEFQRRRAQDYFSVEAMVKAYGAVYQEIMAENTKNNI
jgi:glycosyltransferase involved in cell wall biosynthesis